GRPDWVVEIVSRSTVHKDTQRLRTLYHRAGIPEYWLIDARGAEIEFQILVWRKKGNVAVWTPPGSDRSPQRGRRVRLGARRDPRGRRPYGRGRVLSKSAGGGGWRGRLRRPFGPPARLHRGGLPPPPPVRCRPPVRSAIVPLG